MGLDIFDSGGIDIFAGGITWKATNATSLSAENKTASVTWTDLDLTAVTSANAKLAFIKLVVILDSISGTAGVTLSVRKNGDTPGDTPTLYVDNLHGDIAGSRFDMIQPVGLDSGQVIEYQISISGTIQVDCYLVVMGYIE